MNAPVTDADAIVRSPLRAVDPTFAKLLAVSLCAHFLIAATVWAQPTPVTEETVQEEHWVRGVTRLPFKRKPVEPPVPAAPPEPGPASGQPKGPPVVAKAAPKPPSREVLAKAGLLGVLGSYAEGGNGAFADIVGDQDPAKQLAQSLKDAKFGKVATAGMELGPREGTGPEVQKIGNLIDVYPPPPVHGPDVPVRGPVKPPKDPTDVICVLPAPTADLRGLAGFVNARKKAVVSCYERQLQRTRNLKGKLVVRLHLDGPGRPTEVEVDDEGLNSDAVASCVRTIIGGWAFPFDVRTDVELPFVFDHAE
jgi:hypothetical protein